MYHPSTNLWLMILDTEQIRCLKWNNLEWIPHLHIVLTVPFILCEVEILQFFVQCVQHADSKAEIIVIAVYVMVQTYEGPLTTHAEKIANLRELTNELIVRKQKALSIRVKLWLSWLLFFLIYQVIVSICTMSWLAHYITKLLHATRKFWNAIPLKQTANGILPHQPSCSIAKHPALPTPDFILLPFVASYCDICISSKQYRF